MLDILISLTEAASKVGNITEVAMYPSGFMRIEGTAKDGKQFEISFRFEEKQEKSYAANP